MKRTLPLKQKPIATGKLKKPSIAPFTPPIQPIANPIDRYLF
jgi:hypothetical protein